MSPFFGLSDVTQPKLNIQNQIIKGFQEYFYRCLILVTSKFIFPKINQIYKTNNLYKTVLNFSKPHYIFKMAAPIPSMLKYSTDHNFLNSPPILIKFVSKFMDCNVLNFEAQHA